MLRYALVLFILVPLAFGLVWAGDYYVDINTGDNSSNSGSSPQDAWKTIAHALDSVEDQASASNPVTVHIAEGLYSPLSGESFALLMRNYVSLKGAGGDFKTILDSMSTDNVMFCLAQEVTISDLVIMNGQSGGDGAGMLVIGSSPLIQNCTFAMNHIIRAGGSGAAISGLSDNCHPTVINCTFIANNSKAYGGAIACENVTLINCVFDSNEAGEDGGAVEVIKGEGLIEMCVFMGNRASMGGAIHAYSAESMVISRCEITGNAAYDGGGIHLSYVENALIEDCEILRNVAQHNGGGILLNGSSPIINNCLVAENYTAHFGGGIQLSWAAPEIRCTTIADNRAGTECDGISCAFDGRATIVDCILWGNRDNDLMLATISYSNVQDQLKPGPGNITEDPLFVEGENCAYFLSQIAAGQVSDSPCVGSGSAGSMDLGMSLYSTRTDNVGDSETVDMGYHVPVAMPRVYAWPDSKAYSRGALFRPIVSASNEGPHTFADVYAGFVKPDGETVCFTPQGLSGELSPWVSGLVLEHGFSFGPQVLMEYRIPDDWDRGEYLFFIAFCPPQLAEPIGDPAFFTFTVVEDLAP